MKHLGHPESKPFRLHFIGIGGIGMSGIAEVFLTQGHSVTGSDSSSGENTERLMRLGAEIFLGHDVDHLKEVDVVVISSAIRSDNIEVVEAKRRGIPVIPRAEILAEIMRGKTGIAVAGTHGKTTTTSMLAHILMVAEMDPTVVVGGKVELLGSNAKIGASPWVVVEADESDGSFHFLPFSFSVVTNIDADHMEYFQTLENLRSTFLNFLQKTPFYGCSWVCGDDLGVQAILPGLHKPHRTYGFGIQNDLYGVITRSENQSFEVYHRPSREQAHQLLGEISLSVLGRHNVLNALAAIGISVSIGIEFESIKKALGQFQHAKRRFDQRFFSQDENIRIIDDYGHHPTEIQAVLQTAREAKAKWNHQRIVTFFQPHRYTRTKLCWDSFIDSFESTDVLVLLPIYGASENPIEGITSDRLAEEVSLRYPEKTVISLPWDTVKTWARRSLDPNDLVLTLGAGSVTKLPDELIAAIKKASV